MLKRLIVDIEEEQHIGLKVFCAKNNMSIKEYMTSLIKEDWNKRNELPNIW